MQHEHEPPTEMPTPANDATSKLIAQLWQKNLPLLRERLAQLSASAASAASGTLPAEACREVGATAHKLAGSLGMFGYPGGTAIARKLEILFDSGAPGNAAVTLVEELRVELSLPE